MVEADWSAASYWFELLLLSDERHNVFQLKGLFSKSLQGDSAVQEMFKKLVQEIRGTSANLDLSV
jgi:3-phosphoshikimate 1-carboxyvinyltransferase